MSDFQSQPVFDLDVLPKDGTVSPPRLPRKPMPVVLDDDDEPKLTLRQKLAAKIARVAEAEAAVTEAVTARDKAFEALATARTELSRARRTGGLPGNDDALAAAFANGELDSMDSVLDARQRRISDLEASCERLEYAYLRLEPLVDPRRNALDLAKYYRDNAARDVLAEEVAADIDALEKDISKLREKLAGYLRKGEAIHSALPHDSSIARRLRVLLDQAMALGPISKTAEAAELKAFAERLKTDANAKLKG